MCHRGGTRRKCATSKPSGWRHTEQRLGRQYRQLCYGFDFYEGVARSEDATPTPVRAGRIVPKWRAKTGTICSMLSANSPRT
jgi:hypothetical protein